MLGAVYHHAEEVKNVRYEENDPQSSVGLPQVTPHLIPSYLINKVSTTATTQDRARAYMRSMLSSPTAAAGRGGSQLANFLMHQTTVYQFDKEMKNKNIIMGIIAIIQCLLMVIMLEYPYNDDTNIYEETVELQYLELIQSILTLILLIRIYDYYYLLVLIEKVRYSLPGNPSVLRSYHIKYFIIELLICFFHPFPFAQLRKLGLVMFLRLYLLIRIYRDYSDIFKWRRDIMAAGEIRAGIINYDSWLSIRTLFYKNPALFIIIVWGISISFFSYTLYISERDSPFIKNKKYNNNDGKGMMIDMDTALWYTASTMTTCGYGDIYPVTRWGQAFSALSALWGICLGGLVVMGFVTSFSLDFNQKFAADFCDMKRLAIKEKIFAANLLQKYFKMAYIMGKLRRYKKLKNNINNNNNNINNINNDYMSIEMGNSNKPTLKQIAAVETTCCGGMKMDEVTEAAQKFKKFRLQASQELGQEDVTQLKHILALKRSAEITSVTVSDMRNKQEQIEFQTQRVITTLIATIQALLSQMSAVTGQSTPMFVNEQTGEAQLEKDTNAQLCYFYP